MSSTIVDCRNPRHDHTAEDAPLICHDCGLPSHYDLDLNRVVHDDPRAECLLIRVVDGASPCTDECGLDADGYEPAPPCDGTGIVDLGAGGTFACADRDGCVACARPTS